MTSLGRQDSKSSSGRKEGGGSSSTLLSKMGTLGRGSQKEKKRNPDEVEIEGVIKEGRDALELAASPMGHDPPPPEEYVLDEGEERRMIAPESRDDPKLREVIRLLVEWMNDVLAPQRILVRDIEEDLYDGLVIQKLIEALGEVRIEVPEVSQSAEGQRQKLRVILQYVDRMLQQPTWQRPNWSAEAIQSKNLVAILQLLVALAIHFRAPIRFPEHCQVNMVVVKRQDSQVSHRHVLETITTTQDELGLRGDRDAFDTLFEMAPQKQNMVRSSLINFVNKHLNRVNLELTDLNTQFHDGVYLVILTGLLEGYFVPFYCYHLTPRNFEQKVHNVRFAFQLMEDAGLSKPKARPEDIVNMDAKCTFRVLYGMFTLYKNK